ncbi:hypothetical protein FJ420_26750 [Mesorhizobium sp. B3-1-3]|uniref:hypothetical protein n=1 Tax=unclassified Mesorhizobium TaxID=325217 RepID=UPI00112A6487|nr:MULTISPECIES: hypothetical protein [unclassified Mesorhizobium]TPI57875.1 hypothetical protein FJ424_28365 [Mesorhizobium sp. B3-1-8]TPI65359.1 hypothetical protein FJ420_26750 [Mesorhizobium sp. B3-1-3]TPJ34112.1 hypothetical protein FJ418_12555 [Mesorhizobium sp. B2-8-3]
MQAWQILVGMAKNRQTSTYKGLSVLMYGKPAAGVLAQILGHIAFYCHQNGLPTLNSIVVGKIRGTPGDEIPLDPTDFDKERERVYAQDWYDIYPPSSADFAKAYAKALISN